MDLREVLEAGRSGFLYTFLGICFVLAAGLALGRLLRVRQRNSFLISSAVHIYLWHFRTPEDILKRFVRTGNTETKRLHLDSAGSMRELPRTKSRRYPQQFQSK